MESKHYIYFYVIRNKVVVGCCKLYFFKPKERNTMNSFEVSVQGKMISEWKKELGDEFSMHQLYRIASEGGDLSKLVLRKNGLITLD